jgi:hypothetical protein
LIRELKSKFSETNTDAKGLARLCDAPLEAVDIVVGFDVCGLVTVRDLHSKWPETKRIYVTFEENSCDHFALSEFVQVLMRVQDNQGRPVAVARFSTQSLDKGSGSDVSDRLGRIFRLARRNSKLEGVVQEVAGGQARIAVLCSDDIEMKVILHR